MNIRSRYVCLSSLLLVLALMLAAPGRAQAPAEGEIAATVNGERITVAEWVQRMQSLRAQDFIAQANPLQFKSANGGQVALEALINTRLLLQYAARTSLLPPDAEVEADYQRIIGQPAIKQGLERKQFTPEQVRRDIVAQKALFNVATINQRVTAEEVQAYYDRHPEQFGQPERWQLAVIRVSTKAAADKAQAELKKGTAFATVAAQMSEDAATKGKGGRFENARGEVEWLSVNDARLPEFIRAAVKKLKVGEVTPVLTGQSGTGPVFFLVRLLAKQDMNVQPLEQIRPQVERLALLEKSGGYAAAEKKLDEYRKTVTIEVNLPAYRDLYKR